MAGSEGVSQGPDEPNGAYPNPNSKDNSNGWNKANTISAAAALLNFVAIFFMYQANQASNDAVIFCWITLRKYSR